LRISQLLDYAIANNFTLDFISGHTYATEEYHDVAKIINDITKYKSLSRGLPLVVSEFGSSYQASDTYHDSWELGSFVAGVAQYGQGIADVLSYWAFSDM